VFSGVVVAGLAAQQEDIIEQYLPVLFRPRVLTLEVRHHILDASALVEQVAQREAPCVHESSSNAPSSSTHVLAMPFLADRTILTPSIPVPMPTHSAG